MGVGSIIELSPLFLTLPNVFVSLTLTNNKFSSNVSLDIDLLSWDEKYTLVILQSFLVSSLCLVFMSLFVKLGNSTMKSKEVLQETDNDSGISLIVGKTIPTLLLFLALGFVFISDFLLISPARLINLVVVSLLIKGSTYDGVSGKFIEIWQRNQSIGVLVVSFLLDLGYTIYFDEQKIKRSIIGYSLLILPVSMFSGNNTKPSSKKSLLKISAPSFRASVVLLLVNITLVVFLKLEEFNIKLFVISLLSMLILIFSQVETDEANNSHTFFNKALFMQNYKINLIILSVLSLVINQIGLADRVTFSNTQLYTLASNIAFAFIIIPSNETLNIAKSVIPSRDTEHEITFTSLLIQLFQSNETRSIFNFLLLNISFMFIQLLYSFRSKSLSLLSDSLHMFLDCTSLFFGLLASLVSQKDLKLRSQNLYITSYPFGLDRIETLAGFANGSLLLGIVFEIYNESVQRLFNPRVLQKTNELLIVSVLGLIVNLVGIFAFNHGHDHGGHGGHSHGHGHSHGLGNDHQESHVCKDKEESHNHSHNHSHEHSHEHSHSHSPPETQHINEDHNTNDIKISKDVNDNMHGIFLHILADTLGSLGVVLSTLLIKFTGWEMIDPITSILIATLIFISSIPLLKSSSTNLLLGLNDNSSNNIQEDKIRDLLNDILQVNGVKSYTTPRFWPINSINSNSDSPSVNQELLTGYIHIQYYRTENSLIIKTKLDKLIGQSNIFKKLYFQLENEVDDCWCRQKGIFGSH